MDPISIATNIVAVIETTNKVLKICYQVRTVLKDGPTNILAIINELRGLRSILESLEETADDLDEKTQPAFQFLCDAHRGPLVACVRELDQLESILTSIVSSKRTAVLQTLGWGKSDEDIRASLDRIGRCKSSLSLALSADQTSMLRSLMKSAEELGQRMDVSVGTLKDLSTGIARKQTDEEFRAILNWLSPKDASESHETARKTRNSETCRWVLESEEYRAWTASTEQRLLWVTATPGAGKTILFSSLVDHLKGVAAGDGAKQLLAYFYCDFRDADTHTLRHVFGALLGQMISWMRECPEAILNAYRDTTRVRAAEPKLELIRACITDLCAKFRVFILIDGLDESSSRMEIANGLVALLQSPGTRVLVTSRGNVEIGEVFADARRLRLDHYRNEVARDIRAYIKERIRTDRRLSSLDEDVQRHVTNSLNAKSGNMFRWVQCQLDCISSMRTVKAIKGALDGLPQGLYETYARILASAPDADKQLFRRILLWLSFAVVPLTLEELADAVAVEPGSEDMDDEARLNDPLDILSIGGSLVTLSPNGLLRLAHLSVRDYLTSPEVHPCFAMDAAQAQRELAQSCLTYLSFKRFSTGPARSAEAYHRRIRRYPLLTYASIGFSYHVRAAPDESLRQGILAFFRDQGRLLSWIQILIADRDRGKWDFQPGKGAAVYYAASFGLADAVRMLIREGADVNAPGGRFGGTALHAAVFRQHHEVVRVLLEEGADAGAVDETGYSPVRFAEIMKDERALRIFREARPSTKPTNLTMASHMIV